MSEKVKIVSDRIVGYKVGSRVSVDDLEAAGINVRQWLRCGLAERVKAPVTPPAPVEAPTEATEGDV